MSEREILVADSDSMVRKQMADSFRAAGYDVETTDSTAHVFCSVLEKQIPVVLLGSGCDNKIALANLIPMLKKCNKGVTIILVSDEESLPTMRTVRQEGIYYHALKPAGQDDTEEILAAVNCAFSKNERMQTSRPAESYETTPVVESPCAAVQMTEEVTEEQPEAVALDAFSVTPDFTNESRHGKKNTKVKATAIMTALTAAVAGFVYCVFAVTKGMKESSHIMIWAFLGFCALIAVGQLIPAFFSVRAARKEVEQQLQEGLAVKGEKEPAFAVVDKNK